jgi:hypothetical protein
MLRYTAAIACMAVIVGVEVIVIVRMSVIVTMAVFVRLVGVAVIRRSFSLGHSSSPAVALLSKLPSL